MNNGQTTTAFLATLDKKTKKMVLDNIANHYGIDHAAVLKEITHDEAEHLLDYVTGGERAAVHLFMKARGFMHDKAA